MRQKSPKPARAHGLPNMHKTFTNIPKFRPIIDTTGSSHYLVGKYLAQLYPLTNNKFTLKDSFESVKDTQKAFDDFKNKQKSVWSIFFFFVMKNVYSKSVFNTQYIEIKHKC